MRKSWLTIESGPGMMRDIEYWVLSTNECWNGTKIKKTVEVLRSKVRKRVAIYAKYYVWIPISNCTRALFPFITVTELEGCSSDRWHTAVPFRPFKLPCLSFLSIWFNPFITYQLTDSNCENASFVDPEWGIWMTKITIRYYFRLSGYSVPDDSLQTVRAKAALHAHHGSCSASNRS